MDSEVLENKYDWKNPPKKKLNFLDSISLWIGNHPFLFSGLVFLIVVLGIRNNTSKTFNIYKANIKNAKKVYTDPKIQCLINREIVNYDLNKYQLKYSFLQGVLYNPMNDEVLILNKCSVNIIGKERIKDARINQN